ncbi:hypothetical protein [Kribbella sp. NPDC048915]|uniref:hypothetical protein n=1 Tax=Kribbella sp. NPDC048915 TaxID=3155148 RepID=UPI0033F749CF
MWWMLAALGGGGLALAGRYFWDRRAAQRGDAEDLEQIRRLADEDVTLLGEELRRLDAQVSGHPLDPDARADYQVALDAYEAAQRTVPAIRKAADISSVTDTLATGRYAIVCVQARLRGAQAPERRVPCFFNPQHGPSTTDVVWTEPRFGTRTVPACAQDAARVRAGDDPEVRYTQYGGRRVPYWQAGAAFAPYGQGYFAAGAGANFIPLAGFEVQSGAVGGWGDLSGPIGPIGHDGGGIDAGGIDGGGIDGGGGDGGGGDGG